MCISVYFILCLSTKQPVANVNQLYPRKSTLNKVSCILYGKFGINIWCQQNIGIKNACIELKFGSNIDYIDSSSKCINVVFFICHIL